MRTQQIIAVLLCALALLLRPALAQESESTLDRIAESGQFRIGFVPDSPPMSFLDEKGNAVGYSIDLCREIAASIRSTLGLDSLDVSFVPLVSIEDRLSAVESGDVDIECGATTTTLSRRERVDFTLLTFITGGAILSRADRAIPTVAAMGGRTIVVIGGTTTEQGLREFIAENELDTELEIIRTRDEGMAVLASGNADGFASDRAMLVGQVFRSGERDRYRLTQNVFSFETYAMMLRRGDTAFRLAADRALAGLYRTARIRRIYHNWFGRYGEAMSPVLEAMYEFQAVGE